MNSKIFNMDIDDKVLTGMDSIDEILEITDFMSTNYDMDVVDIELNNLLHQLDNDCDKLFDKKSD